MGCHSHGPESTKTFRSVSDMRRADLEVLVECVFDLRPSEIPEWADWDFYRQVMIDLTAVRAGEIKPQDASWYAESDAFRRAYEEAAASPLDGEHASPSPHRKPGAAATRSPSP